MKLLLILLLLFSGCYKATTNMYTFDVPMSYTNWIKDASGSDSVFYDVHLGNCGFVYTVIPDSVKPMFMDTINFSVKVTYHYPFSIYGDTIVVKFPIYDTVGCEIIKVRIKDKRLR